MRAIRKTTLRCTDMAYAVGLVHMGLALGEIPDHESGVSVRGEEGRHEFSPVAPTLPVTWASGSPLGVIAVP